jgi:hypothetical protein
MCSTSKSSRILITSLQFAEQNAHRRLITQRSEKGSKSLDNGSVWKTSTVYPTSRRAQRRDRQTHRRHQVATL